MRGKSEKERRQNEATERKAAYDKLTTRQKLERLPTDGSKKQRARLTAKLEKETEAAAKSTRSNLSDS